MDELYLTFAKFLKKHSAQKKTAKRRMRRLLQPDQTTPETLTKKTAETFTQINTTQHPHRLHLSAHAQLAVYEKNVIVSVRAHERVYDKAWKGTRSKPQRDWAK